MGQSLEQKTRLEGIESSAAFWADIASDATISDLVPIWGASFGWIQARRVKYRSEHPVVKTSKTPSKHAKDDGRAKWSWAGNIGTADVEINEDMSHEAILVKFGHIPETTRIVGVLEETHWQFGDSDQRYNHRYKFKTERRDDNGEWPSDASAFPLWPVIQPAELVTIAPAVATHERISRMPGYKVALKCGDPQIGFRILDDGTRIPFHDEQAMALFIEVCRLYQPDKITILGDFLDMPAQSHFTQEASFARSTQPALNAGYRFLAQMRAAAPDAEIVLIEGNHDKRLQNFVQNNALAAFGLKRADLDDGKLDWPVLSIPNLLRLDDLNIRYIDAYPAATDWDNGFTRNIHGTKANSKGSTMAQYVHLLPHVSTWAGHTHRAEIVYRSVLGQNGEAIESYAANPGVLCRTDGAVPSVNGAIGADGVPVQVVEDWQMGFGVLYYNDTESWPQVHRIKNGTTIIDGRLISLK